LQQLRYHFASIAPERRSVLNSAEAARLAETTAGLDLHRLVACVKACGFDEDSYLLNHADLQGAGTDAQQALFHFLARGYAENRNFTCGVLPDGLDVIRSLVIFNPDYIVRLFRSLFFAQARNARTAERLWKGIDPGMIECLRAMGGSPYVVIDDSHVSRYLRRTSLDARWLAALPMVCDGGSAMRLADKNSRIGKRILQWAGAMADAEHSFDLPVFLKFGGIDAEFLWMRARIRRGIYRFSVAEFTDFAWESVACYGRFLDALANLMDRRLLRVCAAYPAVLDDANWAAGFLSIQRASDRDYLASELEKTEIPDRSTRTHLRRLYNEYLTDMCGAKSLAFVDDFSPFIDQDGNTDELYYAEHHGRDFHVGYDATEERMVEIIHASIHQ
jgi:hypothetical protein